MEAPALCPERVTVRTKEGVGLSLQIDILTSTGWLQPCGRKDRCTQQFLDGEVEAS